MFSIFKNLFNNSESEIIEMFQDNKLTINLPLNSRKYLKKIFKQDWNKDKEVDYKIIGNVNVGDEIEFYTYERYSPEIKFYKAYEFNGNGLISVIESDILFEVFWIANSSQWRHYLFSKGLVVEKKNEKIKVEFTLKKDQFHKDNEDYFIKLRNSLNKKYNPRSEWEVIFQLKRKITKTDIKNLSLGIIYDDDSIKSMILGENRSFCKFTFVVNSDNLMRGGHQWNSNDVILRLAKSINSKVELDINFKRLGKRETSDWKENEWFYRFTFSPMNNHNQSSS
tara:strand:- start:805 stop:1647 length:843 start_codon:yes stop_codon:yes gene_type:complete